MITTMTACPHSILRRLLEIAVTLCALCACTSSPGGVASPTRVWTVHLDGAVDGRPAVAGGLVVAASAGGTLTAIDAARGFRVWAVHRLGAISSSPLSIDGRVFVTTLTGNAYAFDLAGGSRLWRWSAPSEAALWSSPIAYRDELIIGVASPYGDKPLVAGRLYGLDASTGAERWTVCLLPGCSPGDGIWSTPVIDASGTAFVGVGNPDDAVLAFDAATGKRKWFTSLYADRERDLDVGASPVVLMLDGREAIAQATVEGLFAVLDAESGQVLWSRELVDGSAVHGLLATPAYDGSAVYVPSASPPTGLFSLAPNGGSVRWRHQTDLPVYSAPAVAGGVVVFGTGAVFGDLNAGSVVALDAADGRLLWTFDTHSAVRSAPAFAGDLVVVGDHAGDVMALLPKR